MFVILEATTKNCFYFSDETLVSVYYTHSNLYKIYFDISKNFCLFFSKRDINKEFALLYNIQYVAKTNITKQYLHGITIIFEEFISLTT